MLRNILETVQDIGCKLVLLIDMKSHTGFRLVPKVLTLNDLEPYLKPSMCLHVRGVGNMYPEILVFDSISFVTAGACFSANFGRKLARTHNSKNC